MPCCHAYMTVFEPIRNRHFETAIRLYIDVSAQWEDPPGSRITQNFIENIRQINYNRRFAATGHMIQKSTMLQSKLRTRRSKTKRLHPVKLKFSLFCRVSQCVACSSARSILNHVTVIAAKGPLLNKSVYSKQ